MTKTLGFTALGIAALLAILKDISITKILHNLTTNLAELWQIQDYLNSSCTCCPQCSRVAFKLMGGHLHQMASREKKEAALCYRYQNKQHHIWRYANQLKAELQRKFNVEIDAQKVCEIIGVDWEYLQLVQMNRKKRLDYRGKKRL